MRILVYKETIINNMHYVNFRSQELVKKSQTHQSSDNPKKFSVVLLSSLHFVLILLAQLVPCTYNL